MKNFTSCKGFLKIIIVLTILVSNRVSAQTPGLIYEPASGSGALILDPNGDGYSSATTAGFLTDDQLESEIPYTSLVFPKVEPTSDLSAGPNCSFTDFVDQGDQDPVQAYFDASGNWLFRMRMGKTAPNSKSYSILIDTDGKFGATGPNADPQYSSANPGFEIELVLATKFGVYVYDINNANCTPVISYFGTTNYQKSIALTTSCGNPDYFFDFYVKMSDLTSYFATASPAATTINSSTAMRMAMVDNMGASKSTICSPASASDIAGTNSNGSLEDVLTEVVDNYTPCPPGQICGDRSVCPTINGPIANGATTVSVATTESIGAIIKVYNGTTLIGTSAATTTSPQTLSVTVTAVAGGNTINATAQAPGEGVSIDNCSSVTVAVPCATSALTVTDSGNKGVCGGGITSGATIRVYKDGVLILTSSTTTGALQISSPSWKYKPNLSFSNCTSGGGLMPIGYYEFSQVVSGCEGPKVAFDNGTLCAGAATTPIVNSPIYAGTTTISGTSGASATIQLYIAGVLNSTFTANASGAWTSASVMVTAGQSVYVIVTETGKCTSATSGSKTVISASMPTISGAYCGSVTSVTGSFDTTNGTVGSVQLFKVGTPDVAVGTPVAIISNGYWNVTGLNLVSEDQIYATITLNGGVISTSAITTIGNQTTNSVAITTPKITEGDTSISGTGINGDLVTLYIDGSATSYTATVDISNNWTISSINVSDLYASAIVTVTTTTTGYCEGVLSSSKIVQCIDPILQTYTGGSKSYCYGQAGLITLNASEIGVIYELVDGTGVKVGSSAVGTGNAINLFSNPLIANLTNVYVKAYKLLSPNCSITSTVQINFDNQLPSPLITLTNTSVSVLQGVTIANFAYSNPLNTPTNYSIAFSIAAKNQGFANVSSTSLPSSPINVVVPAAAAVGTYTAVLSITGGASCVGTYPISITVYSASSSPIISSQPSSVSKCIGSSASFGITAVSSSAITYKWEFSTDGANWFPITNGGVYSNATSSTMSISNVTGLDGYLFRGVATNTNGITNSVGATLDVIELPNAGTDGALTVCAGTTPTNAQLFTQLTGADLGGVWSGPVLGIYTYTVNATTPCTGNDTSTVTVTEQAQPNAGTDGALTVCVGTTPTNAQLFAQLTGADLGGVWSGPVLGIYTYTVNATTPCTGNDTSIVTVSEQAQPYAGTDGALTVCTGSTPTNAQLFAQLTGADLGGIWSGPVIGIYTYTVNATTPCTGNDIATVTVMQQNCTPTAANDTPSDVLEDSTLTNIAVLGNDSFGGDGPNVGSITVTPILASVGTAILNNGGTLNDPTDDSIDFTPTLNYYGAVSISYTITDANGDISSAIVTFNVNPINDAPIVDNDTNTTTEDNPTVGGDLTDAGDSDPDGTTLLVTTTPVSGPTNGNIVINSNGTYIYSPNANFYGTETITIEVCDQGNPLPASCVNQTLTITVLRDSDGDMVENNVDLDDDNDGILDALENNCSPSLGDIIKSSAFDNAVVGTNIPKGPFSGVPGTEGFLEGYNADPDNAASSYSGIYANVAGYNGALTNVALANRTDFGDNLAMSSFVVYKGLNLYDGAKYTIEGDFSLYQSANSADNNEFGISLGAAGQDFVWSEDYAGAPDAVFIYGHSSASGNTTMAPLIRNPNSSLTLINVPNRVAGWYHQSSSFYIKPNGLGVLTLYADNVSYRYSAAGVPGTSYTSNGIDFGPASNYPWLSNAAIGVSFDEYTDNIFLSKPPCATAIDTDGDSLPNYLDLDSDNDGCLDAIEGGASISSSQLVNAAGSVTVGTGSTANNQNLCATNACVDSNGVPTLIGSGGQAVNQSLTVNPAPVPGTLSGNQTISVGSTTTFSSTQSGGNWTSSDMTIATVDSSTGIITGVNFGTTTMTYTVTNAGGCTATALRTVSVVNFAPVANNDTATTNEDTPVMINVVINVAGLDTDVDGTINVATVDLDPVTAGIQPTFAVAGQGTYAVDALGVVTFTPVLNFNGTTTPINYTVNDNLGLVSNTATLTITVNPINDAPIVDNDTNTTTEDNPTVGGNLTDAGDSDPDGTPLLVTTTPVNGPTNGTIVINSDGTYVYTPNSNFSGTDIITIEVCDSGNPLPAICVNQTLTITVNPINDAPIVDNDTNTTTEDNPTVGGDLTDAGDSDPDGTPLLVTTTPVSGPTNGTIVINSDGTYVYTPNSNFSGTDTITIEVCDSGTPLPKSCVNQTLTITVNPINDAPIVDNDTNTTTEDNPTVGGDLTDAGDSDPDGTPLLVTTPVSGPTNGTIVINSDGTYVYTPNSNFSGTDTITIEVCDSGNPLPAICVNQTLTITVNPINDAPIVDNDTNTTTEDNPTVGGDLTDAGDSDPDGTPLLVTTTPVSGPTNGAIVINSDGTYVYTPNSNFSGTDTITIEVCDSGNPLPAICVNQTLTITVNPINDAPLADNDSATTTFDTSVIILASTGDTDIDGTINLASIDLDPTTPLTNETTFTVVSEGTYTANGNGTVTFDPLPTFSGITTPVNYTIEDNDGANSNIATLVVTVSVPNIIANPDTIAGGNGVNGNTNAGNVLNNNGNGNDTLNGANVIISQVNLTISTPAIPINGGPVPLVNTATGQIGIPSGTPAGIYTIIYSICEKLNPINCDTATVSIEIVNPAPSPPIAIAEDDTIAGGNGANGNANVGNVLNNNGSGNDTINGVNITISQVNLTVPTPAISINGGPVPLVNIATGQISIPAGTPAGIYTIVYSICEKLNPINCDTAVVTITIVAAPIDAVNDDFSGTPVPSYPGGTTISVVINDTLNGQPAIIGSLSGQVKLTSVTVPSGLTLNGNGTITVASNTASGTYVVIYSICEVLNPTNCETATATVFVSAQRPSIAIIKTVTAVDENGDGFATVGETIRYNFTITNIGNVPLTNVAISDVLPGLVLYGNPISLGVGQQDTNSFYGIYKITQNDANNGEVVNQARVSGTSPQGVIVSDFSDDTSNTSDGSTVLTVKNCVIEVSNVLTPNGDGLNDYFHIEGMDCFSVSTVKIFNRWGVLVFETEKYNNTTNIFEGNSSGRTTISQSVGLPSGTYYYVIEYTDYSKQSNQLTGYLFLTY